MFCYIRIHCVDMVYLFIFCVLLKRRWHYECKLRWLWRHLCGFIDLNLIDLITVIVGQFQGSQVFESIFCECNVCGMREWVCGAGQGHWKPVFFLLSIQKYFNSTTIPVGKRNHLFLTTKSTASSVCNNIKYKISVQIQNNVNID